MTTTLDSTVAAEELAVVIPVVRADPAWEPALAELERLVARIETGPLAAVADWWLVAGAGRASQAGGAYLLPEEVLGEPLTRWMEAVRDLHTRVPPLRWVERAAQLDGLVERARALLELDAHGNVKLPSLRTVWRDTVLAALEPTVRALELQRPAPAPELADESVERALAGERVISNSPLWINFRNRVAAAREAVEQALACHCEVEPWKGTRGPGAWSGPVPDAATPLGRVLALALGLEPDDVARTRQTLETRARANPVRGRLALEQWTRGFRRAAAVPIAELDEIAVRIDELRTLGERLRAAGAPQDDVQLALVAVDEGDLDYATSLLDDCRRALEVGQRESRLGRELARLEADVATLPSLAPRLDELRALLAAGKLEELEQGLRAAHSEADASARAERLQRVARLVDELETLGTTGPLVGEGRRMLDTLRRATAALPSPAAIEALEDRVKQAGTEARRRVERVIGTAEAMLLERRDQLDARDVADIEPVLRLAREQFAAGALGIAEERAHEARAHIERRQVPTWSAAKGEPELVRHLVAYLTQSASFAELDIRRLHVALKTRPFVILAGLTGSGKSTISRLYAEALGATADNGRLLRVAVRPNWIDETEVLGYLNPLNGTFAPGWLATLIRACQRDPDLPFFCILDEMNLAPVEQYLADALSAMEEARSSSSPARMPLYPPGARPTNAEEWEPSLPWPANLFLIGTVNIDETTRALSDRVIDRANVLQLSIAFGEGHHATRRGDRTERPWLVRFSEWLAICEEEPADQWHDLLTEIGRVFVGMRIGLGMRAHVELERFLANADGVLDPRAALDLGLLQRIIPKVRGFKRDLEPGLRALRRLLDGQGLTRSVAVLDDWLSGEVADEAFLDGTDARVGLVTG